MQEAITLFPESGKEDDVANFLQGHLYERRCTLLIFAQLPYLQCQGYVETLRDQLQPVLAEAVKIRETTSRTKKLSVNIEMSLCFTCLFLSRAKLHILLFLSTADKKDFDPVELKIMSEGRFRKQIRMDLIRVSAS